MLDELGWMLCAGICRYDVFLSYRRKLRKENSDQRVVYVDPKARLL